MRTAETAPSIRKIADRNRQAGKHYFDGDTLRFFGQTQSDFKVSLIDGRVIVWTRAHRGWEIAPYCGIASLAEYNSETGEVATPTDADDLRERIAPPRT